MTKIAALGPGDTYSHQAAGKYPGDAEIVLVKTIPGIFDALSRRAVDKAIVPVYNSIDGHMADSFRKMIRLGEELYWTDNIVIPIEHVLGSIDDQTPLTELRSRHTVFAQCAEYIERHFPDIATVGVASTAAAVDEVKERGMYNVGVIASKEALGKRGLVIRAENLVENNRTRFAVLGGEMKEPTGNDASGIIVIPSPRADQKPGWLSYTSGQFSDRKINLIDIYRFIDPVSRSMVFYFECEGYAKGRNEITEAMEAIRDPKPDILEPSFVRFLGSYPRVNIEKQT